MIGVGSAGSTKVLQTEAPAPQDAAVSSGIGLIDWAVRRDPALLEAAIAVRPMVASVSFGADWSVSPAVDIRVLAAGGIATGPGVAVVLAAGASAVWLRTALAACSESLTSDPARQALLRASGKDTVVTSAIDIALGYPCPASTPSESCATNSPTDGRDTKHSWPSTATRQPHWRPAMPPETSR